MNAEGIPVFYGALDEDTCVAEVIPIRFTYDTKELASLKLLWNDNREGIRWSRMPSRYSYGATGRNRAKVGVIQLQTVRAYKSTYGMLNGLGLTQWVWSGRAGLCIGELVAA